MKAFLAGLAIALCTFAMGAYVTAQVNRAAYYIWPDVDPQPKVYYSIECK